MQSAAALQHDQPQRYSTTSRNATQRPAETTMHVGAARKGVGHGTEIRSKIKGTSQAAFVALLVLAAALAMVAAATLATYLGSATSLDPASSSDVGAFVLFGVQTALAAMLAYAALVFRRIGQEETPFFPALPRKVKLAAPFLFLAVAVPRWIGYAVLGAATGRVVGTLFDETSIILLVLAIVVFCLGQILEYGWLLQDESYEII